MLSLIVNNTSMFNFFKQKGKLGIDIGTASIKVVELQKKANRFALNNYGILELKDIKTGTGTAIGQSVLKMPDDEIVWGIKEIIRMAKMESRDVVASLPSSSTFTTVIDMPYISEQDLNRVLPFEAKKYIPIPLDEVVLSWTIIDFENKGALTNAEIFLAAVPRTETDRYRKIMKGAGLNLVALELENLALIRALLGNDLSPAAIVNIGGRSTSIIIADKGFERVGHNYEIGGFEITKSIARSLNISLERAEELKKKIGLGRSDENIINEAMISLVDMMVFETKKTIANYEVGGKKISRVLLVGGLTNMPNFLNYFKDKLGRDTFMGDTLARVVYPENLKPITKEISSTFAVSIGLGMREIRGR